MGQRPYMSPGPDGWSDQQDYWLSPDGVWKRIEWAQLTGRALAGSTAQPDAFADVSVRPDVCRPTRAPPSVAPKVRRRPSRCC